MISRVHPDDQAQVRAKFGRSTHRQRPHEAEFRMCGMDGGPYRWVRSTGRVVERDAKGNPARILGQRVDISEARALQAREADLRALSMNPAMKSMSFRRRLLLSGSQPRGVREPQYTREELLA